MPDNTGHHSNITILTDASLCVESKTAAWSAVVLWKKDGIVNKRLLGGSFKEADWTCINKAEIAAAANALHIATKSEIIQRGNNVNIVSDNIHVVNYYGQLRNRKIIKTANKQFQKILEIAYKNCVKNGFSTYAHKVKAHTLLRSPAPDDNSWSALNWVVDNEAKRHMRNARDMTSLWRVKPPESQNNEGLKIDAPSNDPLLCLQTAWLTGIMEARHVRWSLERLIVEERTRFPHEHAAFNLPKLRLPACPPQETAFNWLRRHCTPEEAVSDIWTLITNNRNGLHKITGNYLLAKPQQLSSLHDHFLRKSTLMGFSGVQYSDRFLEGPQLQNIMPAMV